MTASMTSSRVTCYIRVFLHGRVTQETEEAVVELGRVLEIWRVLQRTAPAMNLGGGSTYCSPRRSTLPTAAKQRVAHQSAGYCEFERMRDERGWQVCWASGVRWVV